MVEGFKAVVKTLTTPLPDWKVIPSEMDSDDWTGEGSIMPGAVLPNPVAAEATEIGVRGVNEPPPTEGQKKTKTF